METAKLDIYLKTVHIEGKKKSVEDILSRWFLKDFHKIKIRQFIPNAVWHQVPQDADEIDWDI